MVERGYQQSYLQPTRTKIEVVAVTLCSAAVKAEPNHTAVQITLHEHSPELGTHALARIDRCF